MQRQLSNHGSGFGGPDNINMNGPEHMNGPPQHMGQPCKFGFYKIGSFGRVLVLQKKC